MGYAGYSQEELRRLYELQKLEEEKRKILSIILTSEARYRLKNVEMVKPELAAQVTNYLIQLYAAGRIRKPITDEQLKQILKTVAQRKRNIKIRRL